MCCVRVFSFLNLILKGNIFTIINIIYFVYIHVHWKTKMNCDKYRKPYCCIFLLPVPRFTVWNCVRIPIREVITCSSEIIYLNMVLRTVPLAKLWLNLGYHFLVSWYCFCNEHGHARGFICLLLFSYHSWRFRDVPKAFWNIYQKPCGCHWSFIKRHV